MGEKGSLILIQKKSGAKSFFFFLLVLFLSRENRKSTGENVSFFLSF